VIIWLVITSIPSKKQRRINKNIKILKQQLWFSSLIEKSGPFLLFNPDIRNIINKYNLQDETHKKENMSNLKHELEEFIQTRNF
jgi:hypothetical protein